MLLSTRLPFHFLLPQYTMDRLLRGYEKRVIFEKVRLLLSSLLGKFEQVIQYVTEFRSNY